MEFEENAIADRFGWTLGFVAGYLLFTTVLWLIFVFWRGMPWTVLNVATITAVVALTGALIRRLLA